ncbi:ExbD/TolR family protein [Castellaniella sp.]|jgi:biopolymer transport protein ExbD|uniref:ExbD/TolR family protein n=1 Tax=Castellaniella sp. TaxID=1955812 RepID=UPI003A912AF9
MNFHHHRAANDDPDINLIPLIDVLLVILIFLAASTSFTTVRELPVVLPQAQAQVPEALATMDLVISRDGQYALDGQRLDAPDDAALANALQQAAQARPQAVLRINADGQATHAAVVRALEAARLAHISRVSFLTEGQR